MSLRRRDTRFVAGLIAAVVVLAGCVHHGDPKVSMKPFKADLVFGVKPPEGPPSLFTPPPATSAEAARVQANANVDLPDLSRLGFTKPRPGPSQVTVCPDAKSTATAPEEAPTNVPNLRLPAEGLYRWKKRGDFTITVVSATQKFTYGGLTRRAVVKATKVTDPGDPASGYSFTYRTIQPALFSSNVVIMDWRVKTAAQFVQPAAATVNAPNQGDPERGLALEAIRENDKDGNEQKTYNFPSGVLFFPLPIRSGTSWQASATDARTLETLSINAQVTSHERIDACGNLVDGWRVNATLTYSGQENVTIPYNYIVATQLGALIIEEDSHYQDTNGIYDPKEIYAQIKPDPLPQSGG